MKQRRVSSRLISNKSLVTLLLLGVSLQVATAVNSFGHSQAELQRLISYFSTTKPMESRLLSGSSQYSQTNTANTYDLVKCNGVQRCVDGDIKATCQWQRFFAYYYVAGAADEPIDIYMGSNGLPDHCYYSDTANYPVGSATGYDVYVWKMKFNVPYMEMDAFASANEYVFTALTTQNEVDFQQCYDEWATVTTLDPSADYSEYVSLTSDILTNDGTLAATDSVPLDNTNKIVGIALNGVYIFTSISEMGLDPFFPQAYKTNTNVERMQFDQCLGTVGSDNTYKYYMYSPCIYSSVSLRSEPSICVENNDYELCKKNPTWHALLYTPSEVKTISPIGLAKDGRVIYGPYKENGELWNSCDVDICNGRVFGDEYYGYVATMFFPYTVGCWGPGNRGANVVASCSTNARFCDNAVMMMGYLPVVIASIFISFFLA